MIYYTTKNALPVKQKMKNAFCENHIFTRFNLLIFFNVTKNCVLQLFVDNVDRKREFREHLRGKKKTKYFLIF